MKSNKFVNHKKLEKLISSLFVGAGINPKDAQVVSAELVMTSLRGVDSHGIRLVPHYLREILAKRIKSNPKIAFVKTAPAVGILDADHSLGIIAGTAAMDKAMELGKKTGVAAVAVKNSSHFGAAAIYALRAARRGFISWAFTNTESLVVPYGGKRPVLGTNPICFAAPCEGEEPICLDMATSSFAWNKLQMLKITKSKIPIGCAVDEQGNLTTSFQMAKFLTPLATYKGYGLGLMVEILSSLLSGAPLGPELTPMSPINNKRRKVSHFFMVLDVSAFESPGRFARRMKVLVNMLRRQKPAKGFKEVLVAGDPEKKILKKRSRVGIPVPADLLDEFEKMARILKIPAKSIL